MMTLFLLGCMPTHQSTRTMRYARRGTVGLGAGGGRGGAATGDAAELNDYPTAARAD